MAGHRTLVMDLLASHKLCEVIHGGNEALPLACFIGGCSLRGLSWGFGVGWRVHQRQAWVGIVHLFTDLEREKALAVSPEVLFNQTQTSHL
jgi:hypothetical protein